MDTIRDTARKRNVSRSDRLASHKTVQEAVAVERVRKHEEKERAQTIRLRRIYKDSYAAWTEFKEDRQECYQQMRSRKGDNSHAIKMRNKQIMVKLQRSQKQVEEYIKARNHETMLKQELRKLREEDTLKEK